VQPQLGLRIFSFDGKTPYVDQMLEDILLKCNPDFCCKETLHRIDTFCEGKPVNYCWTEVQETQGPA
jgi:hypothetical protein